jgi:predicted amidohydrolase
VNVLGLQLDIAWEDKPANYARVDALLRNAAPEPGTLVVLPEMFATGFSMNTGAVAEDRGGPTEAFLARTARKWGIWLIAGVAVRSPDGRVRNEALLFSPAGRLEGFYAKRRLFSPGQEDRHYAPGTETVVFDCGRAAVAPFVCYDLRFPELFRAAATARRPKVYVLIANWPARRAGHWARLLPARAIENQAYVVGVNRVGADPVCAYSGQSAVIDPQGEVVAAAGDGEGTVAATLDLDGLAQYRAALPVLDDMRAF